MAGAAVVAATLGSVAMPRAAHAQALPPGSWQQTCSVKSIDPAKGVMSAACHTPDWEDNYDEDAIWWLDNVAFQYSDCATPIDNIYGRLYCGIDESKVRARLKAEAEAAAAAQKAALDEANLKYKIEMNDQIIAATPAMRSAAVVVLGRDTALDESRQLIVLARAQTQPETRAAIFAKSLDFGLAATFLKKFLARSDGEKYRNATVDLAFAQVYGRPSTPQEQIAYYAKISAGTAWYATIVLDEMKKIPAGAAVREEVAARVAQNAFGRPAGADEIATWKASGQNYATMVQGVRQQIWSPAGADDLVLTVSRALTKIGRPSDPESVKKAIGAWRPMKAVYADMTSPVGRAKLTEAMGNGRPAAVIRR